MAATAPARYEVGDRVQFRLGARDALATVIEDRGMIGYRDEQLVRLASTDQPNQDRDQAHEFEMAASLIRPARS